MNKSCMDYIRRHTALVSLVKFWKKEGGWANPMPTAECSQRFCRNIVECKNKNHLISEKYNIEILEKLSALFLVSISVTVLLLFIYIYLNILRL